MKFSKTTFYRLAKEQYYNETEVNYKNKKTLGKLTIATCRQSVYLRNMDI